MALPPTPVGYSNWNSYIESNAPALAASEGITLQQAKASLKLLYVAEPVRQAVDTPSYRIYNQFTTWADRTVAPMSGRPWLEELGSLYGSLVFDSSAWINALGSLSNWNLGTTWTIEWWSKAATSTVPNKIYTVVCQSPDNNQIDIFYQNGRLIVNNGTNLCDEPTSGVWTHVALSQSAGALKVFYNGFQVGSTSSYNLSNSTDYLTVGRRGNNNFQYFNGEIAGLRINNTALYTSDFNCYTDSVLYPTNIAGTVLLLQGDSITPYVDTSSSAHTITPTNMTWSTDYPVASTITNGSVQFNGVNQYLTGTGNSSLTLDNDFTVEMWIYCGSQSNSFPVLIGQLGPWAGNASQCYVCVSHQGTPDVISIYNDIIGNPFLTGSTIVTDSAWHHVAIIRSSGTMRLFVDGLSDGLVSAPFTIDYTNFVIASNPNDGGASVTQLAYQGLISNLRITKGVAVYTSDFTPSPRDLTVTQSANINGNPSAAITGTQTSLLLNTYYGANFLKDNSTNDFTVTNVGTVTNSNLTPF